MQPEAKLLASRRVRAISTRKAFVVLTGRYRSGQTGQTVNLLALRLRWFESSPAQSLCDPLLGNPNSLFAGHLRGGHRIHRRRSRGHHRRAVAVPVGGPHSQSKAGLQRFGR
jgi:hypothetical protein